MKVFLTAIVTAIVVIIIIIGTVAIDRFILADDFDGCYVTPTAAPFVTISLTRDAQSNVVQHIFYNTETQITYIYDYYWKVENNICVCYTANLSVRDNEGREILEEYNIVPPGPNRPIYQP